MPAGRLGSSEAFAWDRGPPQSVNIRSLKRFAKTKPKPNPLTVAELRELRQRLRRSIQAYVIFAIKNQQLTATDRRKALHKIKMVAGRFVKTQEKRRAGELVDCLDSADQETRKILDRQIRSSGGSWIKMTKTLRYVAAVTSASAADCFPAVEALAKIDVKSVVPAHGRWRDPALANLVAAIEPVWKRATGRTAGPVSIDNVGDTKAFPFAEWLGEMVECAGGKRPPDGRIKDIVHTLDPDRQKILELERSGARHGDKISS